MACRADALLARGLRGCDVLSEQKLLDSVEGEEIRPATGDEIHAVLGASPGSLGAVGTDLFVIADEAHRSQYDFIDGFARHMRDALPNASFIGFTGRPPTKGRPRRPD